VNSSATLASVYGTASVGNGDPILYDGLDYIQLAAASHSPSTGALAGKQSYPRVGQHVHFKNKGVWRISGKRTTGYDNAHRLYLVKVLSTSPTPRGSAIPGFDKNGNAVTISTTQGYMPNLELNAPKLYYDANPTVALFEQIIRLRRKLHQGKDCLMQCGYEFLLKAKDIITQFGVNGSMTYDRSDVDLNISKISIGGFTFNMKELAILNHPDITAIPGFNYPWYFIIAPMDKTKEPKTNIMRNAFSIIWKKAHGGGSRGHYQIFTTGAMSDVPTDDQAVKRVHLRTRKGCRVVAASKFILGQRLGS
jgi:hypothetical protein